MTIEAALDSFYNSFGLPAYPSVAVPKEKKYPYITYEYVSGLWLDKQFPTLNIWQKGTDISTLNRKVRQIGAEIHDGGKTIECDGGMLWITPGTPFSYITNDPEDDNVLRAVININIEFLTNN